MVDDLGQSEDSKGGEPQHHDRTEDSTDPGCAVALNREEPDQDGGGDGYHVRVEHRCGYCQPLDSGQDRDGGCDRTVAVQESRPEEAEQDQVSALASVIAAGRRDQSGESEDPAFTIVVGPHDEEDVLDRDHDHQGPEDQREDPEDVDRVWIQTVGLAQRLPEGVQGTGAYVAVDDPESSERESGVPSQVGRSGIGSDWMNLLDRSSLGLHRRVTRGNQPTEDQPGSKFEGMSPAHLHLGHRLILVLTGVTSLGAGKLTVSA